MSSKIRFSTGWAVFFLLLSLSRTRLPQQTFDISKTHLREKWCNYVLISIYRVYTRVNWFSRIRQFYYSIKKQLKIALSKSAAWKRKDSSFQARQIRNHLELAKQSSVSMDCCNFLTFSIDRKQLRTSAAKLELTTRSLVAPRIQCDHFHWSVASLNGATIARATLTRPAKKCAVHLFCIVRRLVSTGRQSS